MSLRNNFDVKVEGGYLDFIFEGNDPKSKEFGQEYSELGSITLGQGKDQKIHSYPFLFDRDKANKKSGQVIKEFPLKTKSLFNRPFVKVVRTHGYTLNTLFPGEVTQELLDRITKDQTSNNYLMSFSSHEYDLAQEWLGRLHNMQDALVKDKIDNKAEKYILHITPLALKKLNFSFKWLRHLSSFQTHENIGQKFENLVKECQQCVATAKVVNKPEDDKVTKIHNMLDEEHRSPERKIEMLIEFMRQ